MFLAADTGKAQSPIIQSRVDGTASAEVEDERRCFDREFVQQAAERQPGSSVTMYV